MTKKEMAKIAYALALQQPAKLESDYTMAWKSICCQVAVAIIPLDQHDRFLSQCQYDYYRDHNTPN